ncbi:hypothetical protein N7539_000640 [Penicillium diatomitis]|uniref:AB hydrolase-1 domain-containing protein n=1 Tax=Penicillium diatomitis TaxID=2819901 RepID=A0A9W9XM71_9EURO|nr:uncharacterized protein N7539_000640 [Penicillium diatomitis]KAJ5495524.1 hypothetical protein N7539_000640 [Penicillium diatomitis]
MPLDGPPIFVFVPGAWHSPDTFEMVRAVLSQRGHESQAVALPSVGASEPFQTGLFADIVHVHKHLRALVEQGRKIVLVMHSYGGMVGSGAVEGLSYLQGRRNHEHGGVIMAVWLSAFVTPAGKSLLEMIGGQWLPWMVLSDPDDGYCRSSDEETIFYHDLPPEVQFAAIEQLKPHSKLAFLQPASFEPWHEIPCMYLFCDDDAALPLAVQEEFAKTLGNPLTYHVKASHSPFLSLPEETADGLELALKVGLEKCGCR